MFEMYARPDWTWGGWRNALSEMDQLRKRMDILSRSGVPMAFEPAAGVFPLANVTEDPDQYVVRAELPGMEPSEIDISITGRTLTLSGERKIRAEEGGSYHRRERRSGAFNRTITLPGDIDGGKVAAKCANGILTITLPKSEAAKPRQITVQG